jgi:hypothetical protein
MPNATTAMTATKVRIMHFRQDIYFPSSVHIEYSIHTATVSVVRTGKTLHLGVLSDLPFAVPLLMTRLAAIAANILGVAEEFLPRLDPVRLARRGQRS